MKAQKGSRIGIVVTDDVLRAAQRVEGRLVTASVPIGKDLRKSLRQLLTSSPFVGREVVLGLEGGAVLVESLIMPAGATKSARVVCAERLKGDPVFNEEHAALGVAVASAPSGNGPAMVILTAVNRERVSKVMQACRALELQVHAVEAAALAAWRAWSGSGLQVRLLRSGSADVVLAGEDGKLLFCRIVESPIATVELRATITRAASLLGPQGFSALATCGLPALQRESMSRDLGLPVTTPEEELPDPAAIGLATPGSPLTEFTPPEDRVLREKRRARRVSLAMSAVAGALLLAAGVLGYERAHALEGEKAALEAQAAALDAAQVEKAGLQARLAREQSNQAVLVEALPGHRMSRLFEVVANSAPEDLLLETLHVTDNEAPRTGTDSQPEGRVLEIQLGGLAGDENRVSAFADALVHTGAFTDVRVEASERVLLGTGADGERFRIYARAETR